jgi:hypothetical protein
LHTLRQSGFGIELRDEVRRRRVTVAGFEHEGVAGGERDGVHPQRHHYREVERRDPGAYPERLPERMYIHVSGNLVGEPALEGLGDTGRVLDDLAAAHDLAPGVVDDLAVLA